MRQRFRVHYTGNVQGVGFRFRTLQIARRYAVGGFVQNLRDGRVLIVVEGELAEVNQFLQEIREAMRHYISHEALVEEQATGEFSSFELRR